MIATAIRQIFDAETGEQARSHLAKVLEPIKEPAPKVAGLLEDAEDELLAFAFPKSTGPSCAPPTRSGASTKRSDAALTSSASTPTTKR